MADQTDRTNRLEALRELLTSASGLVETLAHDPARDRFLRVYDRIPLEDRATILGVLEREISLRVATLGEGEAITGYGARPNPNARLYVRVLKKMPDEWPTLDHDKMVFSNLRGARIMRLTRSPEVHGRWHAAVVEAFGLLEAEERAVVATVLRELLDVVAIADQNALQPAKATG